MRLFYFCWYLCSCFFMIFTNLRQKNVPLNSEFHYNQFVLLHKLIIYNNGTRIIWYYLITQQINFYDWVFHILDENSMFKICLWVIFIINYYFQVNAERKFDFVNKILYFWDKEYFDDDFIWCTIVTLGNIFAFRRVSFFVSH